MLELGEDLLDRIEIGAVGRQEKPVCACGADGLADRLAFVTAGIIEHDDIARLEGADKELFGIGADALAVNRSVKDAGRLDPVHTQSCEEGQRAPSAMGRFADQAPSTRTPAPQRRHVGLDPGFIQKDEAAGIAAVLPGPPALPVASGIRPVLLAGERGFL